MCTAFVSASYMCAAIIFLPVVKRDRSVYYYQPLVLFDEERLCGDERLSMLLLDIF
jgi:hypothetical protein